jgi:hypothetical protein
MGAEGFEMPAAIHAEAGSGQRIQGFAQERQAGDYVKLKHCDDEHGASQEEAASRTTGELTC